MVTPPIGAGLVDTTVHQEDHHELTAGMVTPPIGAGLVDATVHQEDHHELTAGMVTPPIGTGLVDSSLTAVSDGRQWPVTAASAPWGRGGDIFE